LGFSVEISGEYACFSRPELKVERVSYDVITPSAARGILEAVFWKPAIRYIIDEIRVCNPIKFENIRRNEVNSKASVGKNHIFTSEDRTQRAAMVLKDVRYVIKAHFEPVQKNLNLPNKPNGETGDTFEDGSFNHGKFAEMITRRIKRGQCFHQPCLGTREFPATLRLIENNSDMPSAINEDRNFGIMLYDIDYEKDDQGNVVSFTPTFFRAEMKQGVIDLRNTEVLR
jgi:CRISPR-associated protein Cas5d